MKYLTMYVNSAGNLVILNSPNVPFNTFDWYITPWSHQSQTQTSSCSIRPLDVSKAYKRVWLITPSYSLLRLYYYFHHLAFFPLYRSYHFTFNTRTNGAHKRPTKYAKNIPLLMLMLYSEYYVSSFYTSMSDFECTTMHVSTNRCLNTHHIPRSSRIVLPKELRKDAAKIHQHPSRNLQQDKP